MVVHPTLLPSHPTAIQLILPQTTKLVESLVRQIILLLIRNLHLREEQEEERAHALEAFQSVMADESGKLMEALGTTYCEEEHRRTIKKISDDECETVRPGYEDKVKDMKGSGIGGNKSGGGESSIGFGGFKDAS